MYSADTGMIKLTSKRGQGFAAGDVELAREECGTRASHICEGLIPAWFGLVGIGAGVLGDV